MNSLGTLSPPHPVAVPPPESDRRLRVTDALLPVAVALWGLGISMVDVTSLGELGLPAVLPLVYYAGFAVLVLSAALELRRPDISALRMSLHSTALVVMLYGTAPLVYREGRYSWLYKTVGVVQYINAHGSLNSHIDIYQNWPGFFAFAAWFDRVAGVSTPLAYAKWAQMAFELAAIPLLYLIYDALRLTNRQRWIAILLFSSSNWIGQDYFSPQALGTVLSLGIMAVAMRWLYIHEPPPANRGCMAATGRRLHIDRPLRASAGVVARVARLLHIDRPLKSGIETMARAWRWLSITRRLRAGLMFIAATWRRLNITRPLRALRRRRAEPSVAQDGAATPEPVLATSAMLATSAAVCLIFLVLTFTHQLSPYMLVVQLGALAILRMLRPRWLPLVLLAIAIAYFIPRFGFVNSHFGLMKSIGTFFSNLLPPSSSQPSVTPDQQVVQRSAMLLSLAIWTLAVIGAWLHRRARHSVRALVLLAFSPIVLLAFAAYGHEGILRVYLFSLPWSAALASFVLTPEAGAVRGTDAGTLPEARARQPVVRAVAEALLAPAALLASLTLFIPAFFGDDAMNVMSKQTVSTVTAFLSSHRPGPLFCAFDRAPVADTAKYNMFPLVTIFGATGVLGKAPNRSTMDRVLYDDALQRIEGNGQAYLLVTPSMIAYNNAYQAVKPIYFTTLLKELRNSPYWKPVVANAGAVIYELYSAVPARQPNPGHP